jgi:hypothetical protein
MAKYVVYNIKYDTDGVKVKLPKKLEIDVPDDITEQEDIEQILSDEISNITGFCHFGFLKMKKRKYPKNHDCPPLSEGEKEKLGKLLDEIEWIAYSPLKHLTSSYADAKVTDYDGLEIEIEIEYGSDATGSHYTGNATINRKDFTILNSNI